MSYKTKIKRLIGQFTGKWIIDEKMFAYGDEFINEIPKIGNYIRVKALELVCREISENKISGSVAELGVYQGDFAKYINEAFADKTFFLFDTFQGFDKTDIEAEKHKTNMDATQDFSSTSVDLVLSKMKHPKNCVIKKGYFPESLDGLDERFCFVSLDPDLYKPVLDGLNYFYPRLNEGAYMFIHDYNNQHYPGVKKAVKEYFNNVPCGVPLPDAWGTLIIKK